MTTKYIYRIINNETGKVVPCYYQFKGDVYDFHSVDEARNSNCHGVFKDTTKYRIAKYEVIETLVDGDCKE